MTTNPENGPLASRVSDLEREVESLRRRVASLEQVAGRHAPIAEAPPAASVPPSAIAGRGVVPPVPLATAEPTPSAIAEPAVPSRAAVVPSPAPAVPPPLPQVPPPVPPPLSPPRVIVPAERVHAATGGTAARTEAGEAAGESGPSSLRRLLERLQLWPPSSEGNTEASLGTWWATRIGALLLVIGVVFLGVYVSRNTPAWVRFAELLGVSVGVTALGWWLERKVERFGAVLFGGGLALLYFCAFGGYAVEAMKVIASPLAAAFWQFVAVVVLSTAAVARRSPVMATMAIALGYVTAIFSRGDGLPMLALGAALMLGAAAVILHRGMRWEAPTFVAMPATYLLGALVLIDFNLYREPPARGWVWLFLLASLVMYFLRDWRGGRVSGRDVSLGERIFQGTNSTLALASGLVVAIDTYPEHLAEFYFGAAVVFAGLAWVRGRQVVDDPIAAMFVAKAAGALTLGVIETVRGRTTALALIVQAGVMLAIARRMRSRVLAVGTGIVALVACGFFARDAGTPVTFGSIAMGGQVAFVVALVVLGTLGARHLVRAEREAMRRSLVVVSALVAGALSLLAAQAWLPSEWRPAMMMVVAAAFVVAAFVQRSWGGVLAALLPAGAANVGLWLQAGLASPAGIVAGNAAAVLLPLAVAGAVVGSLSAGGEGFVSAKHLRAAGAAAWGVVIVGLDLVLFRLLPPTSALIAVAACALGILAAASWFSGRLLPWIAAGASAWGVVLWLLSGAVVVPPTAVAVGALGLWLAPVLGCAWPRLRTVLQADGGAAWIEALQVATATVASVAAIGRLLPGPEASLAFGIVALVVGALVLWPGVARAVEASWVCWLLAWLQVDRVTGIAAVAGEIGQLIVAGLAWVPVVLVARSDRIRQWRQDGQRWWAVAGPVHAVLASLIAVDVARSVGPAGTEPLVLSGAVVCALLAGTLSRALPGRVAATALAVWALVPALDLVLVGRTDVWGLPLEAVLLAGGMVIAVPLLVARGEGTYAPGTLRHLRRILPGLGLALVFLALGGQAGGLRPYATVGWGLVAAAVFVTGLAGRARAYRLLGLIGLGLCVPRVFLVDLSSTMHRIIAFVALGVVLLLVGYSYQHFRRWIEADEDAGAEDARTPPAAGEAG